MYISINIQDVVQRIVCSVLEVQVTTIVCEKFTVGIFHVKKFHVKIFNLLD